MSAVGKILLSVALLGTSLGVRGPARAREPLGFPLRVGFFGGWHATSDDYDVLGDRREGFVPGAGPMFGLRLGWRMSDAFTLELESGAVLASVEDDLAWLVPTRLSLAWRALPVDESLVTPIVLLGGGFVANAGGPGSGDVDALFSAGLGVEVRLDEAAALRLEGGLLVSDGVASAISWTPVVTLGIDLLAWRERRGRRDAPEAPPPPRPTPGPMVAGCPSGVKAGLCLDSDDDGRIDAFDRCPVDPALRPDGCPDADADGLVGADDACPRDRGGASEWGCPR